MKISVLFATFKRDDVLKRSLDGYLALDMEGVDLQIVVVDNACQESTRQLVDSCMLPITYLQCAKAGKNSALNIGLEFVRGEYVILTDDDVIPDRDWIVKYVEGFNRFPEVKVFGGEIKAAIGSLPSWLDMNDNNIRGAYGIRRLSACDKMISPLEVWGGNMALDMSILSSGIRFNEDVGPNGINYIMGSEAELLGRLKIDGYSAAYLSEVSVSHQIRSEQVSTEWLDGRAQRQGMGIAYSKLQQDSYNLLACHKFNGVPRYMFVRYLKDIVIFYAFFIFFSPKKRTSKRFELLLKRAELKFIKGECEDVKTK